MDLDFVSVHKLAKKERGQYPAILTSHLVNNPYVIQRLIEPMAYLSVLRQKERRLVGFSRISSFMPATEKEILSKLCFQFGESHTRVWIYFVVSPKRVVTNRKLL